MHYTPAELGFDEELFPEIMGLYRRQSDLWREARPLRDLGVEEAERMLADHISDGLNIHGFLDVVIQYLHRELEPEAQKEAWLVLDPVVQALYNIGYNDFFLDLSCFDAPLRSCGHKLEGKESRPLVARYLGDVSHFGCWTRYCHLGFRGRIMYYLGHSSSHSAFAFTGEADNAGYGAQECEYLLDTEESMPINPHRNENCTFTLTTPPLRLELNRFQNLGFFERGNTLLIPDGEGWKEVTP